MNQPMKSPGVAAILSFIWGGLGQIYNGQIGKGILIMIVQIICTFLTIIIIGYILFPIIWIWNIYDAYKTAEVFNEQLDK